MKGWIWLLLIPLCFCSVSAAQVGAAAEPEEREVVEEIAAKVNGAIITRTDMEKEREAFELEVRRSGLPEADIQKILEEREPHLFRDKIDNLLLVQRGDQLEIDVERDITKYMANIMLETKVTDQDKFAELVAQETGMRYEDFRQNVRDGMLSQRVLGQEVGSKIVIPIADVEEYYEQHPDEFIREERVFLREILISSAEIGDEAALKKAEDIVARARSAERFEDLAREESDADSADEGGWLDGWVKGDLLAELEELVWDKERNYVTDPIKADNGYLILKVTDHHQAGLASMEEVEQEIMSKLHDPLFQPRVREYLTELRRQAFLEIKEGWIDTGAVQGKDTGWSAPAELTPPTVTREEVFANPGHKKLLWLFPVPGTQQGPTSTAQ